MSQTKHAYRNTRNNKVGELTDEQASLFPGLYELVSESPSVAPVPAPAPAVVDPIVPVAPAGVIPTDKKD